ncbi:MAG: ankyrin repeat domain-containing protein [Bacteroidetes bacterium]|nr:ankyrin repeat domain-containing protein [Bacteroidota bacterium]
MKLIKILCVFVSIIIIQSINGQTIIRACYTGNLEQVKEILSADSSQLTTKTYDGETLLHFSCFSRNTELTNFLIDSGLNYESKNLDNQTPILYAAYSGDINNIELLIAKGAQFNYLDANDMAPIHYAASQNQRDAVLMLIKHGSDVNMIGPNGNSIINMIVESKVLDMFDPLVENGADLTVVNDRKYSVITTAVKLQNEELVNKIISSNHPWLPEEKGRTVLLHLAVQNSFSNLVQKLLDLNIDVYSLNNNGGTLLHSASMGGDKLLIESLLERGFKVNQLDSLGHTPLDYAQLWSTNEICSFLKLNGGIDSETHIINLGSDEDKTSPKLEVTYIGNDGFLIGYENQKVLIDAPSNNPFGYVDTDKRIYSKIKSGAAPFNDISILVASHNHSDHCDISMVPALLLNNNMDFVCDSVSVRQLMTVVAEDSAEVLNKTKAVDVKIGEYKELDKDNMKLTLYGIDHSTGDGFLVFATLIEFGGFSVLHIADNTSDFNIENFKSFNLEEKNIDIAFVDHQIATFTSGRFILDNYVKPNYLVLMHVREQELSAFREEVLEIYPKTFAFNEPLEKVVFTK